MAAKKVLREKGTGYFFCPDQSLRGSRGAELRTRMKTEERGWRGAAKTVLIVKC